MKSPAEANELIRVFLVEDRPELRDGLRTLISGTGGFECVGAYASMEDALPHVGLLNAKVALIDLGLPGMSGVEGIREIRRQYPAIKLVVLSVFDDDERVFEAICAGACGYLLKKTPPARLLEGIREVTEGGAPVSPEIAKKVLELFHRFRPPRSADYGLTPHELKLLKMLVDGHNNKSTAEILGVSVHAISFHMRRIYEKLEVHSKSEAVAKALRDGIIR